MKFGKKIQLEVESIEPDWQQYVIPYKRLKKAIKHDERGHNIRDIAVRTLDTEWSQKLEKASEITNLVNFNANYLDQEFKQLLLKSLIALKIFLNEAFRDTQQRISSLKESILNASNPFQKDMRVWREVFNLYKSFPIWEINSVADLKGLSYKEMKDQYDAFLSQLLKQKIAKKLTSSESKEALVSFLETNQQIISLIKFCELNQTAARKILKKFNKSHLIQLDRSLIKNDNPLLYKYPEEITLQWFDVINNTLPNIEDYFCPICMEVLWKPTRLSCGHLFCHWCCIQSQVRNKRDCPLCRSPGAMKVVDDRGTDKALTNYVKTYFPDEVKAKRKEIDREILKAELGQIRGAEMMANNNCSIM